jgi:hypothetical protein
MAPTKAKAIYAVTTLNLVMKGRKAIFKPPKFQTSQFTSQPALTNKASNAFHAKKVSLAVWPRHLGSAQRPGTWLKRREIKMLISP